MSIIDTFEKIYFPDRKSWRAWLAQNHQSSPGIWLIYYKKNSDKSRVPYDDAVEEALCYGWIDSTARGIDEERYCQLFTPRKPKSTWSKLNKKRVKELKANGLMTPAGQACIDIAKKNGSWTILDQVEDLIEPPLLKKALDANSKARKGYEALSDSVKKGLLWKIVSSKRQITKEKWVQNAVETALENYKKQNS